MDRLQGTTKGLEKICKKRNIETCPETDKEIQEIEQSLPNRITVMPGAVGKMGMDINLALFPKTKIGRSTPDCQKRNLVHVALSF